MSIRTKYVWYFGWTKQRKKNNISYTYTNIYAPHTIRFGFKCTLQATVIWFFFCGTNGKTIENWGFAMTGLNDVLFHSRSLISREIDWCIESLIQHMWVFYLTLSWNSGYSFSFLFILGLTYETFHYIIYIMNITLINIRLLKRTCTLGKKCNKEKCHFIDKATAISKQILFKCSYKNNEL